MNRIAIVALLLLAGCSNAPERPGTFETWTITYVSSALSGSTHLFVNGQRVASGSFGLLVGQRAGGSGTYEGHAVSFACSHRYQPVCLVYVDGKQAAELRYRATDEPR